MFTWRIEIDENSNFLKLKELNKPLVLAHWHGDELALIHLVKRYGLATMTSTSNDGNTIEFLIRRLGGDSSKGSSTRGGVSALRGLVRLLKSGRMTSISVDGPRGPYHKAKPGVFELSRLGSAYIVPVGCYCEQAIISHKSWNKIYLPHPFAKIQVVVDQPIEPTAKNANSKSLEFAKDLESRIDAASRRARKLFAGENTEC